MTTSNIGQTLMGSGVMPPSLAQEIANGNFHDNRESFHDYIYSKLILGDENSDVNNAAVNNSNMNTAVFPTNLVSNNYASSIAPQPPLSAVDFTINPNNNQNHIGIVTVSGESLVNSSNIIQSGGLSVSEQQQQQIDLSNATIPSTPQVSTLKPSSSKKSQGVKSHHKNPNSNAAQINIPNHEGIMTVPKPKKHKSPKKKEKTNFCDVCGRGFAEKYTLNRHMLTHTHVKPYSCTKCNMAFSRSDGLAKHMNAGHRRIDAHHCDVCGGTFNSELSFEQHKREYGSTLPFVCNLCMLAFSQCCHLNYHMKSHSLKSDYGVEITAETAVESVDIDELVPDDFTSPKSKSSGNKINFAALNASLNPNIHIKHEVDDSYPYNIDKSGNILKPENHTPNNNNPDDANNSIANLSVSSNSNNHNNPSISTSAGLPGGENDSTTTAAAINKTISEIDMKKYYNIKVPNPRFIDPSSTTTTTTANTPALNSDGTPQVADPNITLFRCNICGKGFTRKYHMQRHVRLHTRGPIPRAHLLDWTRRPYACGVCKMGFTRQHHLTRHMLIHTGERPHSCHICGKAFRRYTNLSLHVRTVHGSERPFKCPICGRGFPRVYSLQRHLNTHGKNSDAQLLMNAGLMPFPSADKKSESGDADNNEDVENLGGIEGGVSRNKPEENSTTQQYITLSTAKIGHNISGGNNVAMAALLSDGSDMGGHHNVISAHRQAEIDRINASIDDTIGAVIKGAMAGSTKPTKPRAKKSQKVNQSSTTAPHTTATNNNINNNNNHATTTTAMQADQAMPLSLHHHQQQQHNEALHLHQQQQQHQHHHQQQQQPQHHHHQQQQQQQQHSRHLSISQDSDQFNSNNQSPILSNALTRHDLAAVQQRSSGGFNDLNTLRSSTPYSQQQQQQHHQHQQPNNNGDRSNTPFGLNQQQQQQQHLSQQQQQQHQNDSRPSSAYTIIHSANTSDKPGTPYTTLNQQQQQSISDRSSTPYSQHSSSSSSHPPPPSNLNSRSTTPFMLNPSSNLTAFQQANPAVSNSSTNTANSAASSRSQNQQQQQPQQIVVTQSQVEQQQQQQRSESRDPNLNPNPNAIIYAHSSNGFQIPMGATIDLSTTPRNRLIANPSAVNINPIRQAPTVAAADFSHNLTINQAAAAAASLPLNLNEAAAFATTNNLSALFPGNVGTLTYHQQQLMGEALSRLDMELQAAHQQGNSGGGGVQLPVTSHSNSSSNSRPY